MKNVIFLYVACLLTLSAQSQNVGIGITSPAARLHVTDSSVLFSATGDVMATPGHPALQGPGRRMMWYPDKAAFRMGYTNGTEWDRDNIGNYTTAMGYNSKASGTYSTAFGYYATAAGESSFATGYVSNATGYGSVAIGSSTTASGPGAFAIGQSITVPGASAVGIGAYVAANGDFSVAIGEDVTANSYISTSLGRQNDPIVASPTFAWVLTEPLLIVGNGTGSSDKKNALAIAKNGNVYIDPSNKNDGTLSGNTLMFGTFNGTGEAISSKRNAGSNQYGLDFYTASANRMSITNGGNVGIGTSTPNAPLGFPPFLGKKITLYPGATGDVGMAVQGNLFQIYADHPGADIAFGYDVAGTMTERMRIKGDGNVGIGTSAPLAKLHVAGGEASLALFGPNSFGGRLYVGATAANLSSATTAQVLASDGNLHIDPASTKNIYVGYYQARDIYLNPVGGRVGIGTMSLTNTLDVVGNAGSAGNFVNLSPLLNSSGVYGSSMTSANNGYGVFGEGGSVGILGQAGLAGAGNRFGFFGTAANGAGNNYGVFGIGSNGLNAYGVYGSSSGSPSNIGIYGAATGGANAYGVYGSASGATTNFAGYFIGNVLCSGMYFGSDRKLKDNIKPLEDALSIIERLQPSVYTFRTAEYKQMSLPTGLQYGLIADEVKNVMPGAVTQAVQPPVYEGKDPGNIKKVSEEVEYNAVNYTAVIPVLIGAIKEQQVIINGLQKQIDELKKSNMKQ